VASLLFLLSLVTLTSLFVSGSRQAADKEAIFRLLPAKRRWWLAKKEYRQAGQGDSGGGEELHGWRKSPLLCRVGRCWCTMTRLIIMPRTVTGCKKWVLPFLFHATAIFCQKRAFFQIITSDGVRHVFCHIMCQMQSVPFKKEAERELKKNLNDKRKNANGY
jgi:hypothetical protein